MASESHHFTAVLEVPLCMCLQSVSWSSVMTLNQTTVQSPQMEMGSIVFILSVLVITARAYLYGDRKPAALDSPTNSIYTAKSLQCSVAPESYQQNGLRAVLFPTGATYPITADINMDDGSAITMILNLHGRQEISFLLKYDRVSGWVSFDKVLTTSPSTQSEFSPSAETKIKNVVANARQVLLTQSSIQFIADSGATRIGFMCSRAGSSASSGILTGPVPSSIMPVSPGYLRSPAFAGSGDRLQDELDLLRNPILPASTPTISGAPPSMGDSALRNEIDLLRNPILPAGTPTFSGIPVAPPNTRLQDEMNLLRNPILPAGTPTLSRLPVDGEDRRVQDEANLLRNPVMPASAPIITREPLYRRQLQETGALQVVASSYYVNDAPRDLYSGENFPISLNIERDADGGMKLLLNAINYYNYRVSVSDPISGVVTRSEFIDKSYKRVSGDQSSVEQRLQHILQSLSRVVSSPDGSQVTLYADNGRTRLTFGADGPLPPPPPSPATESIYDVLPATYKVHNQFLPLFEATRPYVTLTVRRPSRGMLGIQLQCGNTVSYLIQYNTSDGTVTNVALTSETHTSSDSGALDVLAKLKNILGRTQEVTFDTDGGIQFLSDASSTSVSFSPRGYTDPARAA